MGAQQSAAQERQSTSSPALKTCYYELLELERDASNEQIKRAYRRRALELHPDKNLDDVETATRKFAEIQTAYDILSDSQERAWYDSHRDAILRGLGGDELSFNQPEFHNVRLTSTEEILALVRRFNSAVPFTDERTGFFGSLRETFGHLIDEEIAAGGYQDTESVPYTGFGLADDDFEAVVKPFYISWTGFSTRKTFAWKDKYRLSDAEDRRVRRLMEKENKRCRDEAIRDFNDAVRFLVMFARKRDPRYLPNLQSETERQKALRSASAAQAARSRAANQEKLAEYSLPDWAQSRHDGNVSDHFSVSDQDSEVEHIECVVCSKTFKSEKQYEAHERSKKHIKAVQQLAREMRHEGLDLDLDVSASPEMMADRQFPAPVSDSLPVPRPDSRHQREVSSAEGVLAQSGITEELNPQPSDEDYAPRGLVEEQLFTRSRQEADAPNSADDSGRGSGLGLSETLEEVSLTDTGLPKKLGKAKLKREKKAARQAGATKSIGSFVCNICDEILPSKNKLFAHIRDLGHAQAESTATRIGKREKR